MEGEIRDDYFIILCLPFCPRIKKARPRIIQFKATPCVNNAIIQLYLFLMTVKIRVRNTVSHPAKSGLEISDEISKPMPG